MLTAIYKDDMMSASLPQISRKPRAHSHIQRRHDERDRATTKTNSFFQGGEQIVEKFKTELNFLLFLLKLSSPSMKLFHDLNSVQSDPGACGTVK